MSSKIAEHYREIIQALGEDPSREGLENTPKRAAKAMEYLTKGYREDVEDLVNNAVFTSDTDEMVMVRNIEFYSLCEHHLLPFHGVCHIGYVPKGKVLGLSKFARIVEMYARRFQIQESLTLQIANAVQTVTEAAGVGVVVEAQHMCMMMRGVEKQRSMMRTSALLGSLRESHKTRHEFLTLIQ
ncbi:MAG: GTP cyclohydrolase I FolE [Gammaproteobacteria bacterium]|nr:GTP cyclohydrolase I FolE [Gammaproteobacteria bacterium]